MNAIVPNPIGIDVFDCDRRTFLVSVQEMLNDLKISAEDKGNEIDGTLNAIRSLARLLGIPVNA